MSRGFFFNYSNLMTAIVSAIRKTLNYPIIGLCHGMIHVEKYLAEFLGVELRRLSTMAVGINHLTFIYDLLIDGGSGFGS